MLTLEEALNEDEFKYLRSQLTDENKAHLIASAIELTFLL